MCVCVCVCVFVCVRAFVYVLWHIYTCSIHSGTWLCYEYLYSADGYGAR